jgi:tetratricopeptide (TPR) repeat protein
LNVAGSSYILRRMTFLVRVLRCAPAGLLGCLLAGCLPPAQSPMDEEKEPHFLAGKNHLNTMDYPAAIDSFEKALTFNPNSAAAHFQLGWLFDQRVPDPAAAIYHYDQYLKLRPHSENADLVRQHILACKQELARTVSLGPVTEKQQRDLEKLAEDNKRLTEENRRLTEEIGKWRAYAAAVSPTPTNPLPARVDRQRGPAPPPPRGPGGSREPGPNSQGPDQRASGTAGRQAGAGYYGPVSRGGPTPAGRTHVVRAGETMASIARQAGVRLEALCAANPRVSPGRIRAGQTLVLPAP